MCHTSPIYKYILKVIYFVVAVCVSPWARKRPTGDCLMIVGSCIKYTAAGGESKVWMLGSGHTEACVESVRKAQAGVNV